MFNLTDVYLCYKKKGNYNCKRFDDFVKADQYFHDNFINLRNELSSTMIPVCKFHPFKKQVLKYKLSKVFCNIEKIIDACAPCVQCAPSVLFSRQVRLRCTMNSNATLVWNGFARVMNKKITS